MQEETPMQSGSRGRAAHSILRCMGVAAFLLSLAACVGTRVSTLSSTGQNARLERVLIVHRPGSFGNKGVPSNSAESTGNRILGELVPHLYARLPLAFQAQGV